MIIIEIWEEKAIMYVLTSLQPDIAGVKGRNCKRLCQGSKPDTGKLNTDVCLCCSAQH